MPESGKADMISSGDFWLGRTGTRTGAVSADTPFFGAEHCVCGMRPSASLPPLARDRRTPALQPAFHPSHQRGLFLFVAVAPLSYPQRRSANDLLREGSTKGGCSDDCHHWNRKCWKRAGARLVALRTARCPRRARCVGSQSHGASAGDPGRREATCRGCGRSRRSGPGTALAGRGRRRQGARPATVRILLTTSTLVLTSG